MPIKFQFNNYKRQCRLRLAILIVVLLICAVWAVYNINTAGEWETESAQTYDNRPESDYFTFRIYCEDGNTWDLVCTLDGEVLLPSPRELQRWVNMVLAKANKPLIKIDSKLGPEFRAGYEAAYCHQQGVYHCQKAGMK